LIKPLNFRPLTLQDAGAIAALERRLFARPMRDGARVLAQLLADTEKNHQNLSVGLFHGRRLVGYLIGYIKAESVFGDRSETVAYLRELAILPSYGSKLVHFITRFFELMDAYCPGAPLEAEALPETANGWSALQGFAIRNGYKLTETRPTSEQASGIWLHGLRWERVEGVTAAVDKPLPLPDVSWRTEVEGRQFGVRVVKSARQLLSLRSIWDTLLRETPDHTIFQSFDYQLLWCRHFRMIGDLNVLVLTEDDDIVGISPLMSKVIHSAGSMTRQLSFIGSPSQVDRARHLFGRDAAICFKVLMRWLEAHKEDWDMCSFFEQSVNEAATDRLGKEFRRIGCRLFSSDVYLCPYIELDGQFNEYLGNRSRKLRQNLRRARRQLEQHGIVSVEAISNVRQVATGLDRYLALESRSWKATSNTGVGKAIADRAFYYALARHYAESGDFQLRFLMVDGVDVAATFGIRFEDVFYSLMIVHDKEYDRASPGTFLESIELEACFSQNLREFDLLGGFVTNKLRWTATSRQTHHQHFVQLKMRPMCIFVLQYLVRPWLRERLERWNLLEAWATWRYRLARVKWGAFTSQDVRRGLFSNQNEGEDQSTNAGC